MQFDRSQFWSTCLVLWMACVTAPYAAAQTPDCKLYKDQGGLRLLPNLPEAFWQPTGPLRKVRDGLALTIERRVRLLANGGKLSNALTASCRIVYDIWDDSFLVVDLQGRTTVELKYVGSKSLEALKRCVSLEMPDPVARTAQVQVLINPVDAQQEERTRDWLATKGIGGSGAGIMGRAMGAVINLKTESTVEHDCTF